MTRSGHIARLLAAMQLLPALESGEETLVGGQAVLEGVMMRSPHAWGIAVRKPSGEMVLHSEALERLSEKHTWMGWPIVRGVATLAQAMKLGVRALFYAANVALGEMPPDEKGKKVEISGWVAAVNIIFSLGFFIVAYKFLPLLAATGLKHRYPVFENYFLFNLVDGLIRIALFLAFIWGTSLWADLRRVYQYHGAEHKTVFAFESGEPVTIPAAQRFTTYHPRCGTSFLMTVMLISIFVYTLVPVQSFAARLLIRILLLPVIAGLSYEIIRFAAKVRAKNTRGIRSWLFVAMTKPGLWLQRITTQPPADDQVECAIRALDEAMELEKQRGGELVLA